MAGCPVHHEAHLLCFPRVSPCAADAEGDLEERVQFQRRSGGACLAACSFSAKVKLRLVRLIRSWGSFSHPTYSSRLLPHPSRCHSSSRFNSGTKCASYEGYACPPPQKKTPYSSLFPSCCFGCNPLYPWRYTEDLKNNSHARVRMGRDIH